MTLEKKIPFNIPEGVNVLNEYYYDFASIRLRSDGITQINPSDDTTYTLDDTVKVHNTIIKLNENNPMLILHVAGKHTTSENESRTFLASEEGNRNRIASAYVLQSLAQRIVANFYYKMFKPRRPTKFFTNQKDAENWLLSFKQNKNLQN